MKKPIKVLIIVLAVLAAFYFGRLIYGFWIWRHVSAEDQIKIVQANYEKCLAKGKSEDECQGALIQGAGEALKTQADELVTIILDKTATADQRWFALQMHHALSKDQSGLLSKEKADFYFALANDPENPEDLRQTAAEYLLSEASQDKDMQEFQAEVLTSPETSVDYKREAIKSVAQIPDSDEAITALIKALEDSNPEISVKASSALLGQWPRIKDYVPDLLDIAFDEDKPLWARNGAIDVLGKLAYYYDYKDAQVIEKLQDLLDYPHYGIRSAAAESLKYLTGQEYEIEKGTETEILEMFGLE